MSKTRKVRHAFRGTTRQTRLRIDEGLVPQPHERGMRTHDRSGQKLRDVVDPETGFCIGVTGPMESDGTIVRAAKGISASGPDLPERDEATGLWWVGDERLVIRTLDMGDEPIRVARLRKPTADELASRKKGTRLPRPKSDTSHRNVNKPRAPRKSDIQDHEIVQWIKAFCGVDYSGKRIPSKVRRAAVEAMISARQQAAMQLGNIG